jgi:hypothetical protein
LLGAVTPWDFTQSSSAGGPITLLMFCKSPGCPPVLRELELTYRLSW